MMLPDVFGCASVVIDQKKTQYLELYKQQQHEYSTIKSMKLAQTTHHKQHL